MNVWDGYCVICFHHMSIVSQSASKNDNETNIFLDVFRNNGLMVH